MKKSAMQWNQLNGFDAVSERNQEPVRGGNAVRAGYESPALTVMRFETAAVMQASATNLVPEGLLDEESDF